MRQFVADSQPDADGCLSLTGKDFHYLGSVLRLAVGDMVYVRLPGGSLQQMTAAKVDGAEKRIVLTVAGELQSAAGGAPPVEREAGAELWLFPFAAKPPRMELVVRQAVECGVRTVVPVAGDFCQAGCVESARKRSAPGDGRWRRIITEAREQSGSPVPTAVLPCAVLEDACALWEERAGRSGGCLGVVLYEQSADTVPLHEAVAHAVEAGGGAVPAAALMVGAEGGIAPAELAYIRRHGFVPVHFATNILRCETAALYGVAALQSALTELQIWQFKK